MGKKDTLINIGAGIGAGIASILPSGTPVQPVKDLGETIAEVRIKSNENKGKGSSGGSNSSSGGKK